MTAETAPISRTGLLTGIAHAHGTDFLLDAILESGVGVINAFTDEKAMNKVITAAKRMLEEKGAGTPT